MPENCEEIKTQRGLSNTAKLLKAYMRETGIACARTLAVSLDIPMRTIQRLKLDIATCAGATSATRGVSESANDATGGVFDAPQAPPVAFEQKRKSPQTPLKKKTTSLPSSTVEIYNSAQQCARPKVADAALSLKLDWKSIGPKITEACNGALADPAKCAGLLNMSTPMMWIDQGADLDRDVLPTLAAAGKVHHGKGIRSWDYFTAMIAEAKARRERGMPEPATSTVPAAPKAIGGLRAELMRRAALAEVSA